MEFKLNNDVLTIFVEGRLETTNAAEIGDQIDQICAQNPYKSLILDLENLSYTSSTGLRQILRIRKANKDLKLINLNEEIYNVFDMTGFTEMMDISKAYRKLSVEGCEVIGEGSNGIVYRLNEDTIVKVYKNDDALEDIHRERELARSALVMGVNTAIAYDVVKVDNHYGSVFELLSCKSLSKWLNSDPDNIDTYVKVFVDTLKEVHETICKPGTLPSQKEIALNWANYLDGNIDEGHYQKLIRMLEEVPESNNMIHGDYHTGNIFYDGKEAIIIDMDTIAVGNPTFEFGSIFNAYRGFSYFNHKAIEGFLKIPYELAGQFLDKVFKTYFGKEDISKEMAMAKAVGFMRILRRTIKRTPDDVESIEAYKQELYKALDSVDNLIL